MQGFIELRQKDLPINPRSKYDLGYHMTLRRDPELLDKTFDLNKFVTISGKCGLFPNEKTYIYAGDLNFFVNKIPFSLKPEAEEITKRFVDDLIQNISIRVGKSVANYKRDKFNSILRNTNHRYDLIKQEIRKAIKEVTTKYKRKGYDLKKDPRYAQSYLYSTKCNELISDISRSLKLHFDSEKERYSNDVKLYANMPVIGTEKKIKYFQDLTRENLLKPSMLGKKNPFNWIVKEKASISKENSSLVYGDDDLYENNTTKTIHQEYDAKVKLEHLLKGNPDFNEFVSDMSNVDRDVIYIRMSEDPKKNVRHIDVTKSFKKAGLNHYTFERFNPKKSSFIYKDKELFEDGDCIGKFKFYEYHPEDQDKSYFVFLKKNA